MAHIVSKSKTVNRHKVVSKKTKAKVVFPASLLTPIGRFLQDRLHGLEKRKKEIDTSDPFKDKDRLINNASPDTDAEEQFGHARTSAIRKELDRKIIQTKKALAHIKLGSYGVCEDCGNMIDTDRLMIYPEATLCAKCARKREK